MTGPELQSATGAAHSFTSMLYKQKLHGDVTVTATMSWTYRMAPIIVIASKLGKDKRGRAEYREFFEICLFDRGVNVWHHYYNPTTKTPFWQKSAYSRFNMVMNKKYRVQVTIKKVGKGNIACQMLTIKINDMHEFGFLDPSLPKSYQVGITGCEGINRFYDFSIRQ